MKVEVTIQLDAAACQLIADALRAYLRHSPRLTNHPSVVDAQPPPLPPINETRRRILRQWADQLASAG